MKMSNEAAWNECNKVNAGDPYGMAVINYAKRWAELMESRLGAKVGEGPQVADIAEKASHDADTDGITGYMYGCAASILSKCWIHGEDLRRWHNVNVQVGLEGERANENGGTLNPALLHIEG